MARRESHVTDQDLQPVHRIDSDDNIFYVNTAWCRFAEENDCPELPQQVIGTPLWQWIADKETAVLLNWLLTSIRDTQSCIELPFRCDSPTTRRFLRLKIQPLPGQQIEFCSWIEREEPVPEPVRLLDPKTEQDKEQCLQMCSWCKSILVRDRWVALEEAIEQMRLFDSVRIPLINHGICLQCHDMVLSKFDDYPIKSD